MPGGKYTQTDALLERLNNLRAHDIRIYDGIHIDIDLIVRSGFANVHPKLIARRRKVST